MRKKFNVTGVCISQFHYMVDMSDRLAKIKEMVDAGEYFSITKARQYGKTTTLQALAQYLKSDYVILSLDFQMLSHRDFEDEVAFVAAFSREILASVQEKIVPEDIFNKLQLFSQAKDKENKLAILFKCLSDWCAKSQKQIVLMIDEVDSATNNQVFLDFLAQLRGYFNQRMIRPTFWSVILAGVYDIKNLKQKIRPDEDHKMNSPWNIAADFTVDMSFTASDIESMLMAYEQDWNTGMDTSAIAKLIFDYTSGYPFLVSRICKLADEKIAKSNKYQNKTAAWTQEGILEAIKILLTEKNTLFESLINKLNDYPDLRKVLWSLLFKGQSIAYNADNESISMATMFGFIKESDGYAVVANRIFETRLYNMFLTSNEMQENEMYKAALQDKNQFICNGHLNMELILKKFVKYFNELYGDKSEDFLEEDGRRYFLLFLRPIINGTGNYYIESRTRNMRRTDIIVDYQGDQFVIEMKIWRGREYNTRGEEQLSDYLDYYDLEKGYMVSFNFNKNKEIGVKQVLVGNKVLIEAVV
ncbi:MAG: ATP-binding protein [Lachnospiraceae bacterium]|nr:ATP-binding protein [Lachnospiraceae bacterium]